MPENPDVTESMDENDIEVLEDIDDMPEEHEHPEGLYDEEAEAGLAMYLAIDDLDNSSNGLDE